MSARMIETPFPLSDRAQANRDEIDALFVKANDWHSKCLADLNAATQSPPSEMDSKFEARLDKIKANLLSAKRSRLDAFHAYRDYNWPATYKAESLAYADIAQQKYEAVRNEVRQSLATLGYEVPEFPLDPVIVGNGTCARLVEARNHATDAKNWTIATAPDYSREIERLENEIRELILGEAVAA